MAQECFQDLRVSIVFETEALLPANAPASWNLPYLNVVALGKTCLAPHALFARLRNIETEMGKQFGAPRWSPRLIDLDILAWEKQVFSDEVLSVPHKELLNRPFLLNLMATLQPNWCYPDPASTYYDLSLTEILHKHVFSDAKIIQAVMPFPQMVGIVNVTPDSFSDGGKYLQVDKAVLRMEELTKQGASVIDIGAQSTRPGALRVSSGEEWQRLEPLFQFLAKDFAYRLAKPGISLDTYYPEVIEKALQHYPIDWINDVEGNEDAAYLELVAKSGCKIVINHSLSIPPTSANLIAFDVSPILTVKEWAQKKIEKLAEFGISKNKIIVDPGIGFGKTVFQSLSLLKDIKCLRELGCEILVGHSRKSFLNYITSKPSKERDLETIGISHHLYKEGVEYLRVHDVESHMRVLSAAASLEGLHVS